MTPRPRSRQRHEAPGRKTAAAPPRAAAPRPVLSRRRRAVFTVATLLLPVLLFLVVEGVLRLAWPGGAIPAFVDSPGMPGMRIANPRIAVRWFPSEAAPPTPQREPFAAEKPANGFRVFALGESTTAGFPYPRNATFSRMLRDVLRDALPHDSVEVVNLGIAATNSHAMRDLVDEVIAQRPDAVVIYAGHNEYYGALGVGSTQRLPGGDATVPLFLALQRWRVFMGIRHVVARLRRTGAPASPESASFMEALAGNQAIALGDDAYVRGTRQFERNLHEVTRRLRAAGVPVLLGSLSSNLLDQAPFAAPANDAAGAARAVHAAGRAALARGDTAAARAALERARDLDVVRFRAPTEFNAIIRRVAAGDGITYVPVAEAFTAASPRRITDRTLFLEHVHPNADGYALLARTFAEHLLRQPVVQRRRHAMQRVRPWDAYARDRWLTTLDEGIATHTVRTIVQRWPFVPIAQQRDYRGTYRPTDLVDSLAFQVSRGASWEGAKLALADRHRAAGAIAEAAAEYRGLVRDAPVFHEPRELLGQALLEAGERPGADSAFRGAYGIRPTVVSTAALGALAMERGDRAGAVHFLQQAATLSQGRADILFRLSLAYGAAGNVAAARGAAAAAIRRAPDLPGLAAWMETLSRMP